MTETLQSLLYLSLLESDLDSDASRILQIEIEPERQDTNFLN